MADSLVDLVMGVVDPDTVTKIASGIGMDATTAQNVVNSAIPGILGSIASTAASGEGAQRISAAVGSMDMSVMDKLASAAGTSGQASIAAEGSKLLGSLIGQGKIDAIASAVAGSNGTTPAAVKSILGYLTPAVMGVIGQQDPSSWANGAALSRFFASQKGMIEAALPAGLAGAVGGAAAMAGRVGQGASNVAGNIAAAAPRRPSMPSPQATVSNDETSGGVPSWVWIVVAIAVLGALAYYFTRPSAPKVVEKPAAVTQSAPATPAAPAAPAPAPAVPAVPAVPAAPAPAVPAVPALPDLGALGKQATDALNGVKGTLASITDAASATAALPKLGEASAALDKVSGLAAALPAEAKKTLAGTVGPAVTELNGVMDKVMALPGVGDIAKPAVEGLRAKLKALTGA